MKIEALMLLKVSKIIMRIKNYHSIVDREPKEAEEHALVYTAPLKMRMDLPEAPDWLYRTRVRIRLFTVPAGRIVSACVVAATSYVTSCVIAPAQSV